MNTDSGFLIVYLIISMAALIPEALYAVRYHIKSKGAWRRDQLGRTLMLKAVVLSALLAFISFNTLWVIIFGTSYAARVAIGMGLFIMFAVALWRQWWSFEKIQREADKKEEGTRNVQ